MIDFRFLIVFFACTVLIIPACAVSDAQGSYTVRISDCIIESVGDGSEFTVILDDPARGFSEYAMTIEINDPSIAQFTGVKFPAWASLNSRGRCPSTLLTFSAADLNNRVRKGDRNIVLATISLKGKTAGSSEIYIRDVELKDDSGVIVKVATVPGTVHIKDPYGTGAANQGGSDDIYNPMEFVPGDVDYIANIPQTSPVPSPTANLPQPGTLEIYSSPPGAMVIMDGVSVGRTPLVLSSVTPGVHTIILVREGHQDLEFDSVLIEEAARTCITETEARLVPLPGTVSVTSSPSGAAIRVDGESYGITPSSVTLEPGVYEIGLDLSGYYEWRAVYTVEPGENTNLNTVVLEPIPVYTVTVTAGEGGFVFPAEECSVQEGEHIELSFVPYPGYSIDDVYLDGNRVGQVDSILLEEIGSDHLIEVSFLEDVPETPVPPAIEAEFVAYPGSGRAPLAVTFSDTTPGESTSRGWNFGDGTVGGEEKELTHTYESPGNYTVSLTVCRGELCDTEEKPGYITVYLPPEPVHADFESDVTSGDCPLSVSFTDNSTGDIETREWSFGDGTGSSEENPVHVYDEPGVYTVGLVLTGEDSFDSLERVNLIQVNRAVIGGDEGYYRIICNVENASVFLNGVLEGRIQNGMCIVPVYVTGSPDMTLVVVADGYTLHSGEITRYPESGETIELHVVLVPRISSQNGNVPRYINREDIFSNISHQWQD